MFCRRAWQGVAPLARRVFKPASRNGAPVRLMASGLPGGSLNMTYFALCGGGLTAALVYAYKTINSDTERYESRLASMGATAKAAPCSESAPAVGAEVIPASVSAPAAAEASAEPEVPSGGVTASEEPADEVASAEAGGASAEASEAAVAEDAAPPETLAEAGTAEVDVTLPAAPEVAVV